MSARSDRRNDAAASLELAAVRAAFCSSRDERFPECDEFVVLFPFEFNALAVAGAAGVADFGSRAAGFGGWLA